MIRVCCVTPTFWFEHKPVFIDNFIEFITARHNIKKDVFEYYKHLVSSYSWSLAT